MESMCPPSAVMIDMITRFWTSRCIYEMARMNLADHIADSDKSLEELVVVTDTHQPTLQRFLRALLSIGVISINSKKRYQLTPLGETLRSDVAGSLRSTAMLLLSEAHTAWSELGHSLRTGEVAFAHISGKTLWQYLDDHPEARKIFIKSNSSLTETMFPLLPHLYDFSQFTKVIDVGGGTGTLLVQLLKTECDMSGIVFDDESIKDEVDQLIERNHLTNRCQFLSGDMFEQVPSGNDCYILQQVLHNWNDLMAEKILRNIRTAMADRSINGKLIIIDHVDSSVSTDDDEIEGNFGPLLDLNTFLLTGGKERSKEEFEQLLHKTGFKLNFLQSITPMYDLIEASTLTN